MPLHSVCVLVGEGDEDVAVLRVEAQAGEADLAPRIRQPSRRLQAEEVAREGVDRAIAGDDLDRARELGDEVQRVARPGAG
jgi:hypothetical protein